jgi:hypothetical protein
LRNCFEPDDAGLFVAFGAEAFPPPVVEGAPEESDPPVGCSEQRRENSPCRLGEADSCIRDLADRPRELDRLELPVQPFGVGLDGLSRTRAFRSLAWRLRARLFGLDHRLGGSFMRRDLHPASIPTEPQPLDDS